jgi:hypothetical protein
MNQAGGRSMDEEGNLLASFRGSGEDTNLPAASFMDSVEDISLSASFRSSEQEDNHQITSYKDSVQDVNLLGSFRGSRNHSDSFQGPQNLSDSFRGPQNLPDSFRDSQNLPDSFRGPQNLTDSFRGPQNLPDSFWGTGQMKEQVNSFRSSDAEGNDLFPSWKDSGSEQVTLCCTVHIPVYYKDCIVISKSNLQIIWNHEISTVLTQGRHNCK